MRWTYTAGWTGSLWQSGRQALAEKGFFFVFRVVLLWATFPLWRLWFRVFPRTFRFRSVTYSYFFHNHNLTWSNERAVEIPIVQALLAQYRGKRILEVGNVLSYYVDLPSGHEVLDKFEIGPSIRNEDVATFRSSVPYDLIVSISTLEHVGWDEEPKEPGKILRAITNLTDQLAPGGRMLVTLPLGYNPPMDALLARNAIPFSHRYCLRRHGLCRWEEAPWEEIADAPYAEGWPGAQGLVIGVIERT